ncbi:MAG: 3D domain-containing protein [Halofilum sp. (in: g-proteobacteria)]|nr:3D domain-containing protein [Halofilum sp. (in: g-proteobacteria)]
MINAPARRLVVAALVLLVAACDRGPGPQSMEVTATAYTLRAAETKPNDIGLAAWGDQLEPGMKAIAVSRDLIDHGLGHMTEVRIDGLEGVYIVRDKMNARWEKKIDIFMGRDVERAREWGRRTVTIHWTNPPDR